MSRRKADAKLSNGPWIAHSLTMRTSPAWRALSANDKGILEALEAEHMRHGGARNGRLIQTYAQLTAFVSKRQAIPMCLKRLELLGFIKASRAGYVKHGGVLPPNRYGLTYVSGRDETHVGGITYAPPITDDWKGWASDEDVAAALSRLDAERPRRAPNLVTPTHNIESSAPTAPD